MKGRHTAAKVREVYLADMLLLVFCILDAVPPSDAIKTSIC